MKSYFESDSVGKSGKSEHRNPHLDEMLETEDAAKWLKIPSRQLLANSKGQNAKIPGFWINQRVVRFHPRTIIAKLAHDAGLPPELVAAMFGLKQARHVGANGSQLKPPITPQTNNHEHPHQDRKSHRNRQQTHR
ncbi:MAG TPA: hypothetical protein VHG89_04690 [Verrucomicrobiae bacterium]|nr:hypothetical protein [Verrucomicrobiae bacterium]